jgi:hypothetical protein
MQIIDNTRAAVAADYKVSNGVREHNITVPQLFVYCGPVGQHSVANGVREHNITVPQLFIYCGPVGQHSVANDTKFQPSISPHCCVVHILEALNLYMDYWLYGKAHCDITLL